MSNNMLAYTGIGSRSTPYTTQLQMVNIAFDLAHKGYTLRSGGAGGADSAFYKGCVLAEGAKEIFLPWAGFEGSISHFYPPSAEAMAIAKTVHPAWHYCSEGARLLHARNVHQILGWDLKTPTQFVVCWTPDGKLKGGTATALRLAKREGIKIYNLAIEEFVYP